VNIDNSTTLTATNNSSGLDATPDLVSYSSVSFASESDCSTAQINEKDNDACTAGSNGPTVDTDDISFVSEFNYNTAPMNEKDTHGDTYTTGNNNGSIAPGEDNQFNAAVCW